MNNEVKKNILFYAIAIFIAILGVLLRVKILIDNPSFWTDESSLGYNILSLKYRDFFAPMHLQQIAPPFFMIISKFFINILGAGDLILRIPAFIFGLISIPMFFVLLKNVYKSKITIIAGLLMFCCNLALLRYSTEFKPYIIEVFSICLVIYIFHIFDWKWSYKKIFIIGYIFALLAWFAFTEIIFVSVAFLIKLFDKCYKKWLVLVAPCVVSFSLFLIYYINIQNFHSDYMSSVWRDAFFTLQNFSVITLNNFNFFFSWKNSAIILFLGGYVILYLIIFKNLVAEKNKFIGIFSALIVGIFLVLSFVRIYPMYERMVLFLIPLFILFFITPLEYISGKKKIFSAFVTLFSLLIIVFPAFASSNMVLKKTFSKCSCARELTQYLMENKNDKDVIVVDNYSANEFLYYSQYYKFNNPVMIDLIAKENRVTFNRNKTKLLPEIKNFWFYSTYSEDLYDSKCFKSKKCDCNGGFVMYVSGK